MVAAVDAALLLVYTNVDAARLHTSAAAARLRCNSCCEHNGSTSGALYAAMHMP
jgi:hypothetical protein